MELGIEGRRALVCGGSRGMGRAIALQLARDGADVTILARDPDRTVRAAETLGAEAGRQVGHAIGDVMTQAGRDAALLACPEPDILVTNADGPHPGDFHDWTREDWIAGLDAMMLAPIALVRTTLDGMIARRFGRIVAISSRSVRTPQAELGLSNGPRTGLIGFLAGLSRQVSRHNVTINAILPGAFATDAQRRHVNGLLADSGKTFEELWEERGKANPAGRFGRPVEVGALAAFLCSAQAGFITGQSVLIDGGGYSGTL